MKVVETVPLPPLTDEEIDRVIEESQRVAKAMREQTRKLEDITAEDWATRVCGYDQEVERCDCGEGEGEFGCDSCDAILCRWCVVPHECNADVSGSGGSDA